MMQKHILITATLYNTKLMDGYRRALAEMEIFLEHKIKVENSIVNYQLLMRPH